MDLLIGYYLFCGMLIAGILAMFRFLNRPKFRDELGDITSEVGYEEDSFGNIQAQEYGQGVNPEAGEAHIGIGSREGCGLMG